MLAWNFSEIFRFFGFLLFSFMLGCLAMLFLFIHLFQKYLNFSATTYKKIDPQYKQVELGAILKDNLQFSSTTNQVVESCRFINILLAFLFHEWRDTALLQRWILKKINVEIDELLETKAARRLIQRIRVQSIKLGANCPVIHGAVIKEPCASTSNQIPDLVVLDADVEYQGGFWIAVDVDLVFGKSAFLSIDVSHLKGSVRLQLNRQPCTHWSVSFVREPIIDLKIDTSFQSRPLPQLSSLILNQIHRAIRRKHTFPHHKPRYTPVNAFSIEPDDEPPTEPVAFRRIDATIELCTRLLLPARTKEQKQGSRGVVFATVSVDETSCERITMRTSGGEAKKADAPTPNKDLATAKSPEDPGEPSKRRTTERGGRSLREAVDKLMSGGQAKLLDRKESAEGKQLVCKDTAGTAYMMVTRNFTALLSERTGEERHVNVGSITWNKPPTGKPSITEGDRILSINGHSIQSLSQAITVIKQVRTKKARFYFKVQRNRNDKPSKKKPAKSTRKPAKNNTDMLSRTPPPLPEYASADEDDYYVSGVDDDTESDFSDINSDEDKLFSNEAPLEEKATPTQEDAAEAGDVPSDADGDVTFAMLDPSKPSTVTRTSLCNCDQPDYNWRRETQSLDVAREHKYLNVRFWFQEIATTSRTNKNGRYLLAALAAPLSTIEAHCNTVTSQKFTRRYSLAPPYRRTGSMRYDVPDSFKNSAGFRLDRCYGDATISTQIFS